MLLVVGGEKRQRRGHEVHQPAWFLDVGGNRPQLIGERLRLGDDLLELRNHVAHQRLRIGRGRRFGILQNLHFGHHERLGLRVAHQTHPLNAFGEDETALVGHAHDLVHGSQRSHRVHVGWFWRVQTRVLLSYHHDGTFLAQRLDQLDRTLPAYGQGQHRVRKENRIPNRQDSDPAQNGGAFIIRAVGGGRNGRLI